MIDKQLLRTNPEIIKKSQKARGEDETLVDQLIELDASRLNKLQEYENLRHKQKELSVSLRNASQENKPNLLAFSKALSQKVKDSQADLSFLQQSFDEKIALLSNIISEDTPIGGEKDYQVIKHSNRQTRNFSAEGFIPSDHLDLALGIDGIDMVRGAKVSGSRFYYLKGDLALLELALLNLAVQLASTRGFTLHITPTLVKPNIMAGTGFLGAHSDEIYYLPTDDLYLVGTSEVALAGLHADEILDLSKGPLRYTGYSTCYRREAGAAGKDTRGIIRVHQFNKVEMFSYTRLEDADREHKFLLSLEEEMLELMELPYRVIDIASGDLGSSAARKFDCEAYLPSQNRYLELTSTSNCTSFQARRLGEREKIGDKTHPIATLNGTLATTRWLVCILENHQDEHGNIHLPEALQPFMGNRILLEKV